MASWAVPGAVWRISPLFGDADFPLARRNTITICLLRLCFGRPSSVARVVALQAVETETPDFVADPLRVGLGGHKEMSTASESTIDLGPMAAMAR